METDDNQPTTSRQCVKSLWQDDFEFLQLLIDRDPDGLKCPRSRMFVFLFDRHGIRYQSAQFSRSADIPRATAPA